jgi:hypothetical protein
MNVGRKNYVEVVGVMSILTSPLGFVTPVFQGNGELVIQDPSKEKMLRFVTLQNKELVIYIKPIYVKFEKRVIIYAFSLDGLSIAFGNGAAISGLLKKNAEMVGEVLSSRPAMLRQVEKFKTRFQKRSKSTTKRKLASYFRHIHSESGLKVVSDHRVPHIMKGRSTYVGCYSSAVRKLDRVESFGFVDLNQIGKFQRPKNEGLVGVLDLQVGMCKWPVGEPGTSDFGFCGKSCSDRNFVYCDEHSDLVFAAPAECGRFRLEEVKEYSSRGRYLGAVPHKYAR